MRKSKLIFLCVAVLGLIIACGPAPESTAPTPDRTGAESEGDVFPRPTITPDPQGSGSESLTTPAEIDDPDGYPPPPAQITQPESSYPANEAQVAQPESAYPAEQDMIWVVLPVGIQCEEGGQYADLDEAVADLDTVGVVIVDQGTSELIVASACGQPTSEHYGAMILRDGLSKAESLGWTLFNE